MNGFHRSVDAGAIAFHTYLKALCVDLAASLGRVEDVDIEVTSDSIDTSINRAVSLGLITAELVTNALKYAKHASRTLVDQGYLCFMTKGTSC